MKTAAAVEDYVKTIYSHTEWQPSAITPSTLAAQLGLAPSSVTEMVKKLARSGLVTHVPYGAIILTPAGSALALRMLRRHRLIETWLVQRYGYGWDEVHDEAEVLEHSVSDRLLEAIDDELGKPTRDPHGDPIPSAAGSPRRVPAVLLGNADVGSSGRVVRVSDRDPQFLKALERVGLRLDGHLTVLSRAGDGHPVRVRVDESVELDLPENASASIWVWPPPLRPPG